MSLVDAMGAFKSKAIDMLEENGIKNLHEDSWYPAQGFLDVLKETKESTLKVAGLKTPENAELPPNITNLEGALEIIDQAYQMNHKGGFIGSYKFTKTDKKSGKMVCENPYPCAYDMALIKGFMNKFKNQDKAIIPKVDHAEGGCRMKGASKCTYNIKW